MRVIHAAILNILLLGYFAMLGLAFSGALILQEQAAEKIVYHRATEGLWGEQFSGTIQGVDPAEMKVLLQTDLGLEAIPVANTAIMGRLALGDRVTIKLDGDGKVQGAVKTALAIPPVSNASPDPRDGDFAK